MRPPFPHSFSYFFYLSKSSHSRIHFPTFQWASLPPFIFLLLLPFNELPFRNAEFFLFFYFLLFLLNSFSYFSYFLNKLPFRHSFPYFSYLSMSSHSPIHFPGFSTFYWAPIPLFIFLLFLPYLSISSLPPFIFLFFLPFNELRPFPHLFSYFSYLSMSFPSPIFSILFLSFNHLPFPHFHFPTFPSRFPLFATLPL